MPFTLYSVLEAGLLFLNAIAILNRDRFLAKWGLTNNSARGFGDNQPGVKSQIINLIFAVQTVMRGIDASDFHQCLGDLSEACARLILQILKKFDF